MAPTRRELIETYKQNPPPMGIFQIRHVESGRTFVVSARNLQGIMNSHRFQLRFGSHPNKRLQTDWNAGGPDAFAFEELDRLAPVDALGKDAVADLAHLEALWLEKLAPYGDRGYNTRKQ
jgi:hypothetical protein